jgi:hypothetical protein
VVLYGEDGIEIVAREGGARRVVASFDRGSIGAVTGVEEVDGWLLAAGTRGLVRAPMDGGPVQRLIERPLRGIARSGETLYLLDGKWLYAGPLRDPRPTEFFTAADLGLGLEPRILRANGSLAVVIGSGGVQNLALSPAGAARPLSRLRTAEIGSISDAALLGGVVFLIGERGLLVVEPSSGRVIDSVDVAATEALGVAGSHLIAVGAGRLDVVDAVPWIAPSAPASLAP